MPPFNNVIGLNPELSDPENYDFRPLPGSPAEGYGCLTFPQGGYFEVAEGFAESVRDRHWTLDRIEVSGDIEFDTTWAADTVRVTGDVEIQNGVTLTIAEGTRVEFDGHWRLGVQGRLLALGGPEARIQFTSSNAIDFGVDSTLAGAWNGIRFEGTSALNEPSRLEYCIIEHSKSLRDTCMVGALVLDRYSGLDVVNTIIRNNVADWGAALYCIGFATPTLSGCLITDNVAFRGGSAIHSTDSYPRLIACTVAGNIDLNPDGFAPAAPLMSMVSKPQITGAIFWDNFTNFLWPVELYEGKTFYTRYSNIQRGIKGEGCIDEEPLFVGDGPDPFGIQKFSPCVDAGPPDTTELGLPPLDLVGKPRISGGRVDMGAYEYQHATGLPETVASIRRLRAHPNPFNPSTEIRFELAERAGVTLTIYDTIGRCVRKLQPGTILEAGEHRVVWDGRDGMGGSVSSGVYLARIRVGEKDAATVKTVLLK